MSLSSYRKAIESFRKQADKTQDKILSEARKRNMSYTEYCSFMLDKLVGKLKFKNAIMEEVVPEGWTPPKLNFSGNEIETVDDKKAVSEKPEKSSEKNKSPFVGHTL